jgi:hypothetical protein
MANGKGQMVKMAERSFEGAVPQNEIPALKTRCDSERSEESRHGR